MRKFKRCGLRSLSFGLFLAVVGALLLLVALAPRANAEVDANFSWTGATNIIWSTSTNWSPAGPPGAADTALFNSAFSNQPTVTTPTTVGTLWMTTGVAQNVVITGSVPLFISGQGILGTGILVDNPNAFTLTIAANLSITNSQAWTNNSGNLLTVNGAVDLGGNALTVNGTGDTLISRPVSGTGSVSDFIKNGSGTLTLTGPNTYSGGTAVTGGTLLVNNAAGSGTGTGAVTVTGSGTTLGGTGIISGPVTVNAGANIAPGNGGNNTGILTTGALTLAATSNFRIDINSPIIGNDLLNVATGVTITGSNLVVTVGTTLSVGQMFLILNKASFGPITGTFTGVPQGGTVTGSDGTVFQVSYTGFTGNDIVLTVVQSAVPEPSTWIGGALAFAGLAFTQRRRLRKVPSNGGKQSLRNRLSRNQDKRARSPRCRFRYAVLRSLKPLHFASSIHR